MTIDRLGRTSRTVLAAVCLTASGGGSAYDLPQPADAAPSRLMMACQERSNPSELAGARAVLRRYLVAHTPSALGEVLSNQSAAAYGISKAREVGGILTVLDHGNEPGSHTLVRQLMGLFSRYQLPDRHSKLPPLPKDSSRGARRPAPRVDLLSWAVPTPVQTVRRWTFRRMTHGFPPGTQLVLYNTGRARLQTPNHQIIEVAAAASPDRKWLLCWVSDDDETLFASLTGARLFTRHAGAGQAAAHDIGYWGDAAWMPDNDRWVRVFRSSRGSRVVVGRVSAPRWRRVVPLGIPAGTRRSWGDLQCDLLGAVGRDQVLALTGVESDPYHSAPTRVHLFTFSVTGGRADVRPYEVSLPNRTDVMRVVLSRRGDRLAWMIARLEVPSAASYPVQVPECLMVSRRQGTGQRVVGAFGLAPVALGPQTPDLTWLPDNKRVGFRFGHTLWIADVEATADRR